MKSDERELLLLLARERPAQAIGIGFATEYADRIGMNRKRAERILEKWSSKGWWNSGVSTRSGWLEPEGLAEAERQKPAP